MQTAQLAVHPVNKQLPLVKVFPIAQAEHVSYRLDEFELLFCVLFPLAAVGPVEVAKEQDVQLAPQV